MAFIRKRGNLYYLVHNVRQQARVRQIHLACLGRQPHISEDTIRGVLLKYPMVRIDWKRLGDIAARLVNRRFEHDSQSLRELVATVKSLHMDLLHLPLPAVRKKKDRELSGHLIAGLKLLQTAVELKLRELGKLPPPTFEAS